MAGLFSSGRTPWLLWFLFRLSQLLSLNTFTEEFEKVCMYVCVCLCVCWRERGILVQGVGQCVRVFFILIVLNEESNGPVYQDISRLTSVSHRHLHNRGELCKCVRGLYMKWPLYLEHSREENLALFASVIIKVSNLVHFSVPSVSHASAHGHMCQVCVVT